ncbi:unnamed protein product [Amoebophrya sp. A120]|nr:unnamed protein product [Amoebophrya sp. A120]|eukprot:GSA120T00003513001.1
MAETTATSEQQEMATQIADKLVTKAGVASENLLVQSCKYHAKGKVLLNNVSFECAPGELLGVIGPSGSGKSVLLDLLTFSAKTPKDGMFGAKTGDAMPRNLLQAEITHGGERLGNISDFSRHCAFVPCVDSQYPTLTCRQALTHTASILSNDTTEEITDRVNALMDLLGLTTCADTVVGGYIGLKGMSGGQKKRLALGLALLREPKVLYVDEPTSGLDSAAAYNVMKVVRDLAVRFRLCVVITLQQPPTNVFSMLDHVLVLSKGQVAFSGPRREMLPYFERAAEIDCPAASNPADFVLDLVNPAMPQDKRKQKGIACSVVDLLENWKTKGKSGLGTYADSGSSTTADDNGNDNGMHKRDTQMISEDVYERALQLIPRKKQSTAGTRLKAVFAREWRVARTDPVLYLLRPIIMWVTNVFMILLWWEGRGHDNKYVMSKIWPLFMIMTSNSIYSIVCVYFFKSTFPIVSQEVRNGYYKTAEYLLAIVVLSIPIHFLLAAISMYGSIYFPWFGGWYAEPSYWGLITQFLLIQVFDACGRVCAMTGPLILGMGGMIQFWYASFLFCGMFLDPDNVPWPFRAFTYMSPHRHATAIFLYSDFEHEESWGSAAPCATATGVSSPTCIYLPGETTGFTCPDSISTGGKEDFNCWGYTGVQVLKSLKTYYPAIDTDDDLLGIRVLVLIGLAFYFTVVHAFLFYKECWSSGKVELPPNASDPVAIKPEGETVKPQTMDEKLASDVLRARTMTLGMDLKPFEPENPNRFECCKLSVQIKAKKPMFGTPTSEKPLVKSISLKASGGQVCAMLGPSGAGKTTWLDAVTFNLAGNLQMQGLLYVNGRSVTHLNDLAQDCVYVPQYIQLIQTLTCRQNLEFTANLVMADKSKIPEAVEKMLVAMGLKDCEDQKAGGILGNSGMTAGQKKRLCVACGLLREPRIMFLDEPTTGIDSASAYLMMYYLRKVAQLKNMVVVCTIHQPSYEIWSLCDEVAILASGEMAYCGPRPEIQQHFSSIGFTVPALTNPAEYYLDLVNSDFASKEQQEKILSGWKASKKHTDSVNGGPLGEFTSTVVPTGAATESTGNSLLPPSGASLIKTLFYRELLVSCVTDPTPYLGRMMLYMGSSIFFDIAYAGHFEWSQENAMMKAWLMGWIFCAQTLFAAAATVFYNFSFKLVKNEIRNGFYSAWMYLTAMTLISIPMCLVLAMCVLWIPTYWLGNMRWNIENVLITHVNVWVYYISFEFFAQMASVLSMNVLIGLLAMIVYWYNAFLFSGLMVNIDEVNYPFKLFTYTMPTRWGLANQMYIEFAWTERSIPGAVSCPVVDGTTFTQAQADLQQCQYPAGANAAGYTCLGHSDVPAYECFGNTGEFVLRKLNALAFKTFEPENDVALFMLLVAVIAISNKMGHVFFFYKHCSSSPPLPPPEAPAAPVSAGESEKQDEL